jgi:hypothetical protein
VDIITPASTLKLVEDRLLAGLPRKAKTRFALLTSTVSINSEAVLPTTYRIRAAL